MKYDPRLILVSRSSIRASLLSASRYRFIQAAPPFDDLRDPVPPGDLAYADMPMRGLPPENSLAARCRKLAQLKSLSLAAKGHPRIDAGPHTILMGVHTELRLASAPDSPLPRISDTASARRFLTPLFKGCILLAVTSACFLQPDSGGNHSFDDHCSAVFPQTPAPWLEAYLASDAWHNLPAALAFSALAPLWPAQYSDDPATFIGLPMLKLPHALERWSITPTAA